jgi:hypothetical protein
MITVGVAGNGTAELSPAATFYLDLDTDQNQATGNLARGGIEFIVWVNASGAGLLRWDGSSFVGVGLPYRPGYEGGGGATFQFEASDVGSPAGFNFWVAAQPDNSSNPPAIDFAPDQGTWNYSLQSQTVRLTLADAFATTPKAGRVWVTALEVRRSDTNTDLGSEGHLLCTARLGHTTLRAATRGFVKVAVNGSSATAAVCAWKLPNTARRRSITATIAVSYQTSTINHTFRATVH